MGVGSVLSALVVKLAADEVKEWLPKFSLRIVTLAVQRLPISDRERYKEEWSADLLDYPGKVTQFVRAVGFLVAAERMRPPRFHLVLSSVKLCFIISRGLLTLEVSAAKVYISRATRGWIKAPKHFNVVYWRGARRKQWAGCWRAISSLPKIFYQFGIKHPSFDRKQIK